MLQIKILGPGCPNCHKVEEGAEKRGIERKGKNKETGG